MPNHPNRGPKGPAANPAPSEIKAARHKAGLSQSVAASLIHSTLRTWQDWEAGKARMHPGLWELFRAKTKLSDTA
jgi:DNA (cytosine-5)-methyltransferase 1